MRQEMLVHIIRQDQTVDVEQAPGRHIFRRPLRRTCAVLGGLLTEYTEKLGLHVAEIALELFLHLAEGIELAEVWRQVLEQGKDHVELTLVDGESSVVARFVAFRCERRIEGIDEDRFAVRGHLGTTAEGLKEDFALLQFFLVNDADCRHLAGDGILDVRGKICHGNADMTLAHGQTPVVGNVLLRRNGVN